MVRSTGRLRLAPDVQSAIRWDGKRAQTKERPRSSPSVSSTRCGAGPTHNTTKVPASYRHTLEEGADMAKRTRTPGLSDSGTPATAVTITPASEQAPVTTTPTVA